MTVIRYLVLLTTLSWVEVAHGDPAGISIGVSVNGIEQEKSKSGVKVPLNTSEVSFHLSGESLRMRYKLEGVDQQWQEKSDRMNFILRFINEKGNHIKTMNFPVTGESEGWKGSVQTSEFETRREIVTAPADAKSISLAISSSGPVTSVGVIAVKGISISSMGPGRREGTTLVIDSKTRDHRQLKWNKSGTHPTMASMLNIEQGSIESPVLIVVDDDLKTHADILSNPSSLPPVIPGERLDVRWQEAYSIGLGGGFTVSYERLPPGSYRLIAEELTLMGIPTGKVSSLIIELPGPYWKRWWFWLGNVMIAATIAGLWARAAVKRRINRHLRHAQLLSDERLRIARDLHDDLGTRLSHISLIGAHAASGASDEESQSSFRQITELSGELVGALSETVWMLNSKNNDLESLVDFLCRQVSELCRLSKIRCRIDAIQVEEDRAISHEFRHNFCLSVKESVNNALRHSNCTEIQMKIWRHNSTLSISISDDGVGLSQNETKDEGGIGGSGLESIRQRMSSIGGICSFESLGDRGLRVLLSAPLK